jgi:hypothetical protein
MSVDNENVDFDSSESVFRNRPVRGTLTSFDGGNAEVTTES